MTTIEAMKLALDALENMSTALREDDVLGNDIDMLLDAITALRQALANEALDKMAENARELGLDYEPSAGTQVSKVWWDGERLMAKPIPLDDFYEPAQPGCKETGVCVQTGLACFGQPAQPVAWPAGLIERIKAAEQRIQDGHAPRRIPAEPTDVDLVLAEVRYLLEGKQPPFWVHTSPPAQRTWVGLTDEEITDIWAESSPDYYEDDFARAIEAKLKEKNCG
jgi:hypothetical protein